MRMRKYSIEGQRVAQLKRLLRNDKILVKRIVVAAHEKKADSVYIFFEHTVEEVAKEKVTLKRLKEKAESVADDKLYAKLTNSKQRELFLLDRYGLSKKDSADVIELIKMVEMEKEIGKGEEEETKKEGKNKNERTQPKL